MATTTYGTEYVQSSDLVSNWPGSSLSVANRIDNVSLVGNGVNNQTGTSYTLVLADGGKLVTFSNAAAVSLTVPTNASVAFPTGVRIKLTNKGAGTVTVAGAGGVTLNGNQLTIAQNRSAMLYKLDTNTWVMTADTSVPSDPGLAFITSSTFSAVSSVSVNNCFNSTYENYLMIYNIGTVSTSLTLQWRLRASGTDNSTASAYRMVLTGGQSNSTVANVYDPQSYFYGGPASTSGNYTNGRFDILRPQLAQVTTILGAYGGSDATDTYVRTVNGHHTENVAYDGFSLIASTGTMAGTVRVYGYRNS